MLLDELRLHSVIFQLQYPIAYEIWDSSGRISRRLTGIWPDLRIAQAEPNRVSLVGRGVSIRSEPNAATLVLRGLKTLDTRSSLQVRDAVEIWKEELQLRELKRVSMRVNYVKEFSSFREANLAIFAMNLVRWPSRMVFDQPTDGSKNGVEVTYRFEDEAAFSVLRVRAEGLAIEQEVDPDFFDEPSIKREKNRMNIDFDHGFLKPMEAGKFRADEWIKGYMHILRRDIEKVLKGDA